MRVATFEIRSTAIAGVRCDGCKHNHYSAPGGQALRPFPHSWCLELQRAIPMRLGPHEKWLSSEIPADCPTFGASRVVRSAN